MIALSIATLGMVSPMNPLSVATEGLLGTASTSSSLVRPRAVRVGATPLRAIAILGAALAIANITDARTARQIGAPVLTLADQRAETSATHILEPRRVAVSLVIAQTLARLIDREDDSMRKGFSEQIDVQCLAAGVAVDLTTWTAVKVQTSVDGATWVDRTTTIVTASAGKVRAVLTTADTSELEANTTLHVRVSGVDGSGLTRCFPDDADLDLKLRVTV